MLSFTKGRFQKKNNNFYGIFQFGRTPPPYFGKLLRMTRCFDLWHLKIRGVTFNYSLFWSGEGEGGSNIAISVHIQAIFKGRSHIFGCQLT